MIGPTLETERLILRPPEERDLDRWAAFMADAETMSFLGGPKSRAEAWQGIASALGHWVLKGFGMFSTVEKESGAWVGRVGPLEPEGWPGTEVGWGIAREHWGKGYATESAAAAIDWAFDTLGWSEVVHCIDSANAPSIRVAQRLGSTKGARVNLPPPWQEHEVDLWGQRREQWRGRSPR
jgi:RimJ/RimL family protein N-acetyltransferase